MKTSGHLVGLLVELPAGVQHRHGELDSGHLLFGMDVDWNAAPVVYDLHRSVGVEPDADLGAESRHGLVDGVVDDLVNEVMQSTGRGRPDVHARPLPYRLQALEHLDLIGPVVVVPVVALLVVSRHLRFPIE